MTVELQLEEEIESRNPLEGSSCHGASTPLDIESRLNGTVCLVELFSCESMTLEVGPKLGF